MSSLSYAVITPARDEETDLGRLAGSLITQTKQPTSWVIVDNGSVDGTKALAEELAERHSWIGLLSIPGDPSAVRGAPIVRALHAGIDSLEPLPAVVVSVDADVSFEPDYFQRLLAEFDADQQLGIASGSAYEFIRGEWRQRFVTGSTVWGAARAYRAVCLQAVLPLDERLGWDGIDEFKANARGWRTTTFLDLPFKHHRPEGARDASRWNMRRAQGELAHYVGYRVPYLILRTAFHARREPAALGLLAGFLSSAWRRAARCEDRRAIDYVRSQQSLARIMVRALEALGRRGAETTRRVTAARRS